MKQALPQQLVGVFQSLPALAVAFSGGLDSRFLLHAAKICQKKLLALHVTGPHIADADTQYARIWARQNAVPLFELQYNPLTQQEVKWNRRERCYYCKKSLLTVIASAVGQRTDGPWVICDGSHAGDGKVFRPGAKALQQAGIISPLALANLDKPQIRKSAASTGLENPEQRARPCLLTRFAYNLEVCQATLKRLAACEAELERYLPAAVDFRLRLMPEPVLQIVGPGEYNAAKLEQICQKHGFAETGIMPCATVSGFFDL